MYSVFYNQCHRLLKDRNVTIRFVDIGSRNGLIELADLAPFVEAYGFEPNRQEYEKLLSGHTDAALCGVRSPTYRSLSYSPFAVADEVGEKPLYITRGPGACGLLEPDFERLREIRWKGMAFNPNFAEHTFTVERIDRVATTTLASFARSQRLTHIDYLKIDVEGSEFEVLTGAGSDLLRHTGVIKAELCFIPFRKGQKLFSEVDILLRSHAFDLLRFEVVPAQIGFKERTTGWNFGPDIGIPERYGQPLQCDAIYVNRGVRDPDRTLAMGAVLLEKNYLDEALHIFRTSASVTDAAFLAALRSYRGNWKHRAATRCVRSALAALEVAQRTHHRWVQWRNRHELRRRGVSV